MPEKPKPAAAERLPPKLIFDWRDWLPHLADEDASAEEKRAMIEAVWSIVMAFIDLDWRVVDEAGAEETCGQVLDLKAALEAAMLHSENAQTDAAKTPKDRQTTPQSRGQDAA